MTETIDIVALVQNNPLTRLSSDYGSKILQKIQSKFTEQDQQLFVANFYCYFNYNPKTDFIIPLDRLWKWLGYNRINDCYRLLINNFKENVDFKIENFALANSKAKTEPIEEPEKDRRGGHNREYITLTVNCFKKLCLKSRTERADQIHDYYIGLEEILNEVVAEQTEELKNKLFIKDQELKIKNKELEQISKKRIFEKIKKDTIYVYKLSNDESSNEYKIGKTGSISDRESSFITSNTDGRMVYYKECKDRNLTEKVVHHILDKYRIHSKREWFDLDIENIKQTVDAVVYFLDEFINVSDQFNENEFSNDIKQIKNKYVEIEHQENEDDQENFQKEEQAESKQDLKQKVNITIKQDTNFDKFLDECCILEKEAFVTKKEIFGMYKLFSKTKQEELIRRYLETKFIEEQRYFEEFKSTFVGFLGIKLKPFKYNKTNKKIDDFIEQYCDIGPIYRVGRKNLEKKYGEFLDKELTKDDKTEFQNYISNAFYNTFVVTENSKGAVDGFWGIKLKDDESNIGLKISSKLKKEIYAININTQQIDHTFQSAKDAAQFFNVNPSTISTSIKYKRERNGYLLSFSKEGETVTLSRQNKRQIIYKLDPLTKEVYEKFNNISAAANSIPIGRWEFSTRILDKNEHSGFLWTSTI